MNSVQCTVTVYSAHCRVYSVQYTVYSFQYIMYGVEFRVYTVMSTVAHLARKGKGRQEGVRKAVWGTDVLYCTLVLLY